MRTTNKLFKEQVQNHVINCLSTDETTDLKEQLQITVDEFKNWYGPYEQKRTPNKYDAFKEWLLGLPSCLNVAFTNYDIYRTLKYWFESLGEAYKEQPSDKEADLYYHLVTREFQTLCKKNDIHF